jgi:hypothetical protein
VKDARARIAGEKDYPRVFHGSHAWACGSPVKHEKIGGAGLRARGLWWHRLPACAPHRQDAGATKNFSRQHEICFSP